jgi:hypothetical protein
VSKFPLLTLEKLPGHFDKHYGKGNFEMMQVEDMAKARSLDDAVKGV